MIGIKLQRVWQTFENADSVYKIPGKLAEEKHGYVNYKKSFL